MNTLLVVTPLKKEFTLLAAALTEQGYTGQEQLIGRLPGIIYAEGRFILAQGGHGKVQFAIHTQYLLGHVSAVELVICAGAAGSLVDTLAVGDVVVATTTIEHDYTLKFVQRPLPCFAGHAAALFALRQWSVAGYTPFRLHLGPIASGDEDVVDSIRAQELHSATAALAVAWEGAGGARACAFHHLPFLEIRGITDTANKEAPVHFEQNLALAMRNIATTLTHCWPLS
jgi:adenosylhomocysteine nucleosidase